MLVLCDHQLIALNEVCPEEWKIAKRFFFCTSADQMASEKAKMPKIAIQAI